MEELPTWHYVIGDIHGCYQELKELEEKIGLHSSFNKVKPFIISVGDLIDRGPASHDVIDHFRLGVENGTHAAIMGNHELMMLQCIQAFAPENFEAETCAFPRWLNTYLSDFKAGKGMAKYLSWDDFLVTTRSLWMAQGGFTTLNSFGCDPYDAATWALPETSLAFLLKLPFFYEDEKFVATHALVQSEDLKTARPLLKKIDAGEVLADEEIIQLQKATFSFIWNRTPPKNRPHEKKMHISGHTPFPFVKRLNKIACSQIDTSCVFGGKLTALCVETNKLLSVKAHRNYLA